MTLKARRDAAAASRRRRTAWAAPNDDNLPLKCGAKKEAEGYLAALLGDALEGVSEEKHYRKSVLYSSGLRTHVQVSIVPLAR